MSWSAALLLVPTAAYALAAVVYGLQKNWPLVIVYVGYSFANVGLLWLDKLTART